MNLSGRKVLVTGGAGGIGRATIVRVLAEGAEAAAFDVSRESLTLLRAEFPSVKTFPCDVGDASSVEEAVANLCRDWETVDVLVNNAGIVIDSLMLKFTSDGIRRYRVEDWEKVIKTNLTGVFFMTLHVAEVMVRRRTQGVIVNVSSISAAGNPGQSAYAAAKAGVNALTVTWASEFAPFRIRVAGLAPGFTDTELPRLSMKEKTLEAVIARTPLRRMASPDEIADGIMFAIRNEFYNGRVLELDGGLRI